MLRGATTFNPNSQFPIPYKQGNRGMAAEGEEGYSSEELSSDEEVSLIRKKLC